MRGVLTYVHADKPMEVHYLSHTPEYKQLSKDLGGLVEIVSIFDQYVEGGKPCRAIVMVNEEGLIMKMPFNFWATAAYHMIARAKGIRIQQMLVGLVIIATGDEEFLNALLD